MAYFQGGQFTPPEAAAGQDGQDGAVAFAGERSDIRAGE